MANAFKPFNRYLILQPVQVVQNVQSLRSVQNVRGVKQNKGEFPRFGNSRNVKTFGARAIKARHEW